MIWEIGGSEQKKMTIPDINLKTKAFKDAMPSTQGSIIAKYSHINRWDVLDWDGWRWRIGELSYDDSDLINRFEYWARLPGEDD